ncbi:MAG: DUF6361 family protein [Longimicrobiaceae bacterium]
MTSSLAWLDHDAAAHERTKRILALFQERGTVDQLGLGGIRDSFADLFFPGTSTIQTRLRYFLFVPWIYSRLEEEEVPARRIAAEARDFELALIGPLLSAEEAGVFGSMAGGNLKRLPSEVYWGGLGSWGIRCFDASRDQYHRAIDEIYQRRHEPALHSPEGTEPTRRTVTWHPELPAAPTSFPEQATLSLEQQEAEFLRDRITAEHRSSLLAWLALHPRSTEVAFPWEHPLLETMPAEHRRALRHARLFSEVMNGAPILYNRMLSEEVGRDDLVEKYRRMHAEWTESLDRGAVADWPLDELFAIARAQGTHGISAQLEEFVRRWVARVRQDPVSIAHDEDTRKLIRYREMLLKGARSLFRNRKALEERYAGDLGIGQLDYRWPGVELLLGDLHAGLARS